MDIRRKINNVFTVTCPPRKKKKKKWVRMSGFFFISCIYIYIYIYFFFELKCICLVVIMLQKPQKRDFIAIISVCRFSVLLISKYNFFVFF